MSSATSTSEASPRSNTADAVPAWQLFALAGLVGATFVVFMSRGQSAAAIILLSATIFAAAAVGIAALRTLTPLVGESLVAARPDGPRAGRAHPRRARAGEGADPALDQGARVRPRDGQGVRRGLRRDGGTPAGRRPPASSSGSTPARPTASRSIASWRGGAAAATPTARPCRASCGGCGTANDADARFCKQCGQGLARA